ncbi:hypothetical protein [Maridesulfovibrio bastinii]|uniref:hypothetical protein n=1 Tax=Maridesulfovibrio bastinii TaxID=47157 RepID=UPI00041CEF50|nr:hypothetical protein [Maridesulfovibrio bastinii]
MPRFLTIALAIALYIPSAFVVARADFFSGPPVGESYIANISEYSENGTVDSLVNYLSEVTGNNYLTSEKLYKAPAEDSEETFFISVFKEKKSLTVAQDVCSYAGTEKGLAAAFNDGTMKIWSRFHCSEVHLPSPSGAKFIGYAPGSPFLVATNNAADKIFVYDLRNCTRVPGQFKVEKAPVTRLALSETGEWLSYIDAFNILYSGPVKGPLRRITAMEGTPIFLGYSPAQGIMIAVQGTGRVTMLAMRNDLHLKTENVSGGPFVSAEISGYNLCLRRQDGRKIYWNIISREKVQPDSHQVKSTPTVFLKGHDLIYSSNGKLWKYVIHNEEPIFIVEYSKEAKMIRVRDLDHKTRYYDMHSGAELKEVDSSDWKVVSPRNGVYKIGRNKFKLFDRVYQKGGHRLNCRYVPGSGFILWWVEVVHSDEINPHPMELPLRKNILASEQPVWFPLTK